MNTFVPGLDVVKKLGYVIVGAGALFALCLFFSSPYVEYWYHAGTLIPVDALKIASKYPYFWLEAVFPALALLVAVSSLARGQNQQGSWGATSLIVLILLGLFINLFIHGQVVDRYVSFIPAQQETQMQPVQQQKQTLNCVLIIFCGYSNESETVMMPVTVTVNATSSYDMGYDLYSKAAIAIIVGAFLALIAMAAPLTLSTRRVSGLPGSQDWTVPPVERDWTVPPVE